MRKTSLFILYVCFSIVISLIGTSVSPSAAANELESDNETTLSQSSSPQLDTNYVKAAVKAKKLYVIRLSDMSETESVMIASLQGILANKSSNQIYILPDEFSKQSVTSAIIRELQPQMVGMRIRRNMRQVICCMAQV